MRDVWRKAILLYLVIGALFYFCVDYRKVAVKLLDSWFWLPKGVWDTVSMKRVPDPCLIDRGLRYYRNFSFMLPKNVEAYTAIGFLEYHQGHLEASRKAYQKALALNPDLPGLRYDLAMVLLKENQKARALELLKQEVEALSRTKPSGPMAAPDICSDEENIGRCLIRLTYQDILWLTHGEMQDPVSAGRQPLFYYLPMRKAVLDGHPTLAF